MLESNQISFVSLNELIPENHQYRKFKKLWNFDWVNKILKKYRSMKNTCMILSKEIISMFTNPVYGRSIR